MESKYIDLVINRLTQAQYDELKKNNQISEEEIYDIIDHDDLFYYKTQLYTRTEIENKLTSLGTTIRNEFKAADASLSSLITANSQAIEDTRADLISTNNSIDDFKTEAARVYATKTELNEYSPVEANAELTGNESILDSITIDGVNYQVYPEGTVEFSNQISEDPAAVNVGSIKVGNDIWNIPSVNTDNFYTKKQVDTLIADVDVSDQLTDYALKSEIPTKTSQLTNDSGFLTQHQSLAGYATETYVNTKVADLVDSSPDALNTLKELSTALGNDPNFATTIATQIGSKADRSNTYTKGEVDTAISDAIADIKIDIPDIDIESQLEPYALKTEIPTKVSQLTNDKGYLTSHQSISHLETKTDAVLKLSEAKTYTDSRIIELVGTAPETLDTIYEISTALAGQEDVIQALETNIASKVNKSDVYTKTEIDNKDFTNVIANPELDGSEAALTSLSIKGVNYKIEGGTGGDDSSNSLILSDEPVEGANSLASITINGDSWNIVGSGGGGSLNPDDLADYYTKSEVNAEIRKVIGAAPDAYDTLKEIADYIESDLSTGAALEASIAKKANTADVYTKSEANSKFASKSEIPAPTDLSNYYTKSETLAVVDTITGLDNYYDKSEINAKVETLNSTKQDTLVSGTNIKTINGVSIMGTGNILINEGGSGGTPVAANPELLGGEEELTSIAINNVNYALPAGDMLFSEVPVGAGEKTLKTIYINDDVWSIEKGSTIVANIPLSGDEEVLDSVLIDDVPYTLKGEEMLFYETELPNSVPLKTISINGDNWYVGGISETYVDEKISQLVNAAPETLDTIGELARALEENSSVIDALNSAISNKADKTEIIKSYNDLTNKPTIPNIVFSETEPTNPTLGMIWLKPAE